MWVFELTIRVTRAPRFEARHRNKQGSLAVKVGFVFHGRTAKKRLGQKRPKEAPRGKQIAFGRFQAWNEDPVASKACLVNGCK